MNRGLTSDAAEGRLGGGRFVLGARLSSTESRLWHSRISSTGVYPNHDRGDGEKRDQLAQRNEHVHLFVRNKFRLWKSRRGSQHRAQGKATHLRTRPSWWKRLAGYHLGSRRSAILWILPNGSGANAAVATSAASMPGQATAIITELLAEPRPCVHQ